MEIVRTPTVHVVATTVEGTEAALTAAATLARNQAARIVLLVPLMDAEGWTPEHPAESQDWLTEHYEQLGQRLGQSIQIRACDCADATEATKRLTPIHATIVLGGPALWVWPSPEERLAARLRRSGRDVIFVGCNS